MGSDEKGARRAGGGCGGAGDRVGERRKETGEGSEIREEQVEDAEEPENGWKMEGIRQEAK